MPDLSLGQLIRNTRLILKMDINILNRKVGISHKRVSEIERDVHTPSLDFYDDYISQVSQGNFDPELPNATLIKLADALGLSRNQVMSKAGRLPASIIKGFLEFPEEINNAEKYFAEKFAYRKTPEGQIKMRNNPT